MRVIVFVVIALAAGCARAAEMLPGPYEAQVLRVIDGDTVEARVRVWLGLDLVTHVRLRGLNAPELHGPCAEAGRAARERLARLVGTGPVTLARVGHDKYGGRIDAVLLLADGVDAAERLGTGHLCVSPPAPPPRRPSLRSNPPAWP